MTREEAARILDPETSRDELWKYEADTRIEACNEACRMGDDAIRAKQERENPKPITNADRIRAMSDEKLVVFLDGFSGRCLDCAEDAKNKSCQIYKEGRYCRPRDIMEWLQQPEEGE